MTKNELYAQITELKGFLYSTDYKVIRAYEQNQPVDAELLQARQAARNEINRIEVEIENMPEEKIITENNLQ